MKQICLALFAAVVAFSFVGAQGAAAHERKMGPTVLLTMPLEGIAGIEAKVVEVNVGPGWKIANHFHPSHIFVYVIKGAIKIEVEGKPTHIVRAGDVLYALPNNNMVANNISSTKGASILIFSVGDIGKPLTVMVK